MKRPLFAAGITPAATFRTIETARPTLVIDEADSFLPGNEPLRAILNAGHSREGGHIIRCAPGESEPQAFSTFAAVAIALIGRLSGKFSTLEDRSIVIQMRRKKSDERVERLTRAHKPLLLDDVARGPSGLTQNSFGKLREPMVRLVQWGRTFGITSARSSWKIGDLSNPATQLGQSPLRSPSVFNFFRPGYVPPSTSLSAGLLPAPEFQLVNESSVSGYLNYMQGAVRNGIYVNAPDVPSNTSNASNGYDITAAYTAELAVVLDAVALVKRFNLLLCAGQLSAANQTLIVNALNATPLTATSADSARRDRIAAGVLLVMASADYLIQK